MNKYLISLVSALLLLSAPVSANVIMPPTLDINEGQLSLNGAGSRTKIFMSLYDGGLYLSRPNNNAEQIMNADEAMAIRLNITSSFISIEAMKEATLAGFVKSTNDNIAPIEDDINALLATFEQGIGDGDTYQFSYSPGQGVSVVKNNESLATIGDLTFKKAFFGIWLSDHPVQESLKQQMLGN